jgi:hypothetical protein
MGLRFTGRQSSTAEFETVLEAFDGDQRVVVVTSREALDDHGLELVRDRASEKYYAGEREPDGRVRVFTGDL